MLKIIRHRINRISDLNSVATNEGVEIDLRSSVNQPGTLHLSHDAWVEGERFESWLKTFKDKNIEGPILLNTKEDGLEDKIEQLLSQFKIENYFFIDTCLPTLVRLANEGRGEKLSVRISQFEPKALAEKFLGKVRWLWVDCFQGKPIDPKELEPLKPHIKICLVSPELHGSGLDKIEDFRKLVPFADAVCTKHPEKWLP